MELSEGCAVRLPPTTSAAEDDFDDDEYTSAPSCPDNAGLSMGAAGGRRKRKRTNAVLVRTTPERERPKKVIRAHRRLAPNASPRLCAEDEDDASTCTTTTVSTSFDDAATTLAIIGLPNGESATGESFPLQAFEATTTSHDALE